MKTYKYEAKCVVRKDVEVEAKNEQQANAKFSNGDWIEEMETEMMDCEIINGPELVE